MRVATCRAGNVIGGGDWAPDRIVPDTARALAAYRPVSIRNPESIRPWQHVLEPLGGYLLVGARLLQGADCAEAWNFGPASASCRPVKDLVELILHEYGRGTWESVSSGHQNAPYETSVLTLACHKSFLKLGWRPRWPFETTVARTAQWYRRYEEGANPFALCEADIEAYEAS